MTHQSYPYIQLLTLLCTQNTPHLFILYIISNYLQFILSSLSPTLLPFESNPYFIRKLRTSHDNYNSDCTLIATSTTPCFITTFIYMLMKSPTATQPYVMNYEIHRLSLPEDFSLNFLPFQQTS